MVAMVLDPGKEGIKQMASDMGIPGASLHFLTDRAAHECPNNGTGHLLVQLLLKTLEWSLAWEHWLIATVLERGDLHTYVQRCFFSISSTYEPYFVDTISHYAHPCLSCIAQHYLLEDSGLSYSRSTDHCTHLVFLEPRTKC